MDIRSGSTPDALTNIIATTMARAADRSQLEANCALWIGTSSVMIVNGQLYPLHLAISKDWKIHYFSADMRDREDHRREEANFLADMASVLGGKAMAALKGLAAVLGLDYGGIDFGLNEAGEILLFEANATMVVEQPDGDPRWDYRRAAVERIQTAVRNLLLGRAGAISIPGPAAVNESAAGW